MDFLVFSHTRMGGGAGFCTNVGYRDRTTGQIIQARLRVSPNDSLKYSHFGPYADDFRTKLLPGSVLGIKSFYTVIRPRVSHPEDRIIRPEEVSLQIGRDLSSTLLEYAEEMACNSVHDLFPDMSNGNDKWYRPAGLLNPRSVGYVRALVVSFYKDFEKPRAFVTDAVGNEFTAPVVGVDLLGGQRPFGPSLVRLSLAGGFAHANWRGTVHPERCYLMLSHVIAR